LAAVNTVELTMIYIDILNRAGKKDMAAKHQREEMIKFAHRHLSGLERWLEGRSFIATDSFTVADILMSLVLSEIQDAALFAPYPRVRDYRERCKPRPAWKTTIDAYCDRVKTG
jgi:glutathione S-transferase